MEDTTAGPMSPSQAASFMPAISQRNIHEASFLDDSRTVDIHHSADYERLNNFSNAQKNNKGLRKQTYGTKIPNTMSVPAYHPHMVKVMGSGVNLGGPTQLMDVNRGS